MSDLSRNGRLSNMDFQNHVNSRPKFQPIRVKELLNFCESDDDESEDRGLDSDSESESDEPQPLQQDDHVAEDFENSLSLDNEEPNCKANSGCTPVCTSTSSKQEEFLPLIGVSTYKLEKETSAIREHELKQGAQDEVNIIWHKQPIQTQPSTENRTNESTCQADYNNKHTISLDCMKQSLTDEALYKNNLQPFGQQISCKTNNNNIESSESVSQQLERLPHSGVIMLHGGNSRRDVTELKTLSNEDKVQQESVAFSNKPSHADATTFANTNDQWALQTPLKHGPNNSTRPVPCFSRRNIAQTPQTKTVDISKNHILTPATILLNKCSSNVRQTPVQNRGGSIKDSKQSPKNSVCFTPSTGSQESQRYVSSERKVRKPLADTLDFAQNDSLNRLLLQSSQLPKLNEVTPNVQNKFSNKSIGHASSLQKQFFEVPENAVYVEPSNEELKENKPANMDNLMQDKETVNKVSNSTHISHCGNNDKETLNPASNFPQKQNSEVKPRQEEVKKVVDNMASLQFSLPVNILKSRQPRSLFVKGKEYLILGTLGQGMSGEVLRVQDCSTLELCAIKCVNLNRMDKDSAQGCLEEISMLHKLQAPCVVKMFDHEIKYPMVYVVMEMGDTDLSRLLKAMSQEKHIPLTMILYYWTEMLTAVKHIHDNGVIHSDLKPANFLLVRGRLKLIDFGIASSMNADMTSVVKNCPIGTLNYISPEALMDIGGNSDSPTQNVKYKISFKSDVWSLGCILYSLVYGHTPFHHIRSQWAKVNAITNPRLNIRFPATLPTGDGNEVITSPPVLIDVMRKCLQHDPKARPTVAELLQVDYIPTKQERVSTKLPDIPANTLVKIKRALDEDEWRQFTRSLENRQYT